MVFFDFQMIEPLLTAAMTLDPPLDSLGEGAPAGANGAPAPRGGGGFPDLILLLIVVFFLALIIPAILGNRRERKRREQMLSSIRKHDRVQTIGGIIGSVVEVKPETVVLKVDESANTRITFARTAVQQILSDSGGGTGQNELPVKDTAETIKT